MADLALLEELDNFAPFRNQLRVMAAHVGEWAGIPIGIEGEELVIEPRYPFAKILGPKKTAEEELAEDGYKIRNSFYVKKHKVRVHIYEKDGKLGWTWTPAVHHLDHDLRTLGCSFAWGIEQEAAALQMLAGLTRHHTFKQYLLTGTFLETSKRSGITYMFRKLRPTVALVQRADEMRILCALCMHPIAYYAGSWAGAMCPTDDVVAHLMLMRGDEPMFWRRCNQHAANTPEAGL